MTIQEAVENFRQLIEDAILEGGNEAKTAMIRSSKPILNIHEAVKHEMLHNSINDISIFPPLNARTPELKLAGALKKKDQDICLVPEIGKAEEILKTGLLDGEIDEFGFDYTEQTIAINIRSQISSIQKNFDTLYERTIMEAINLHERCPKMVLGEVYMIAIPEYDDKQFKSNTVAFKKANAKVVEKYIKSFQAINARKTTAKEFYKYEAVCLLIIDFSKKTPIIYESAKALKKAGLLPSHSTLSMQNLSWNSFAQNLLYTHENRFGTFI
mgnify:CR=1 FL=1